MLSIGPKHYYLLKLTTPIAILPARGRPSVEPFKLRQSPALVQEGLLRAVEPEPEEQVHGYPVRFLPVRGLRSDVDVRRPVGVPNHVLVQAVESGARGVEEEGMNVLKQSLS